MMETASQFGNRPEVVAGLAFLLSALLIVSFVWFWRLGRAKRLPGGELLIAPTPGFKGFFVAGNLVWVVPASLMILNIKGTIPPVTSWDGLQLWGEWAAIGALCIWATVDQIGTRLIWTGDDLTRYHTLRRPCRMLRHEMVATGLSTWRGYWVEDTHGHLITWHEMMRGGAELTQLIRTQVADNSKRGEGALSR